MRIAIKSNNKKLFFMICLVSLMCITTFSTLAYLTDKDSVTNIFTVGNVDIVVDETAVDPDGTPIIEAERVKENKYHMIPGQTYIKDPTMTVKANSEDSYVRMLLSINCANEFDVIYAPEKADLTKIFNGYNPSIWIYKGEKRTDDIITYEFRYRDIVVSSDSDQVLDALFDTITVPCSFTNDQVKLLENLEINIEGHAIQAVGFDSCDEAWEAFDDQYK